MRRALPMAGCGTSPSPPISLEVSTMTTRLCSSSGGTVAEGEGRWRCKGERASGGKASGAPPAAQHIAAQLCRSRQARVHSRSGLKAPAPAPAAAGACPGAGLSPDSTRAISRMTVVLPTPGRPRNRTELGTAGRWGSGRRVWGGMGGRGKLAAGGRAHVRAPLRAEGRSRIMPAWPVATCCQAHTAVAPPASPPHYTAHRRGYPGSYRCARSLRGPRGTSAPPRRPCGCGSLRHDGGVGSRRELRLRGPVMLSLAPP